MYIIVLALVQIPPLGVAEANINVTAKNIDNMLHPKPEPTWDAVIAPQLVKVQQVEEQRQAEAKAEADRQAKLAAIVRVSPTPAPSVLPTPPSVVYASSDVISLGQSMAASRGWTGVQWDALYHLFMRESGWNPNARNGSSGACGIPQALPCSKIVDHSPAGQIAWGLDYIAGRYGTPANAWAHSNSFNWY